MPSFQVLFMVPEKLPNPYGRLFNPQIDETKIDSAYTDPVVGSYLQFSHLKHIYRTGWLEHGIPLEKCESVADHTSGVAFLALTLAIAHFPELNMAKLLQMALIHDFGETEIGDLTPSHPLSYQARKEKELDFTSRFFSSGPFTGRFSGLLADFETKNSAEARFLKEVDALEMALQAIIYERALSIDLTDFFRSARTCISLPPLQTIFQTVLKLRQNS